MVDNVCIIFSTISCLIIIIRAAKLDRLPWFDVEAIAIHKTDRHGRPTSNSNVSRHHEVHSHKNTPS
jgi:hypothetical protein